MVTVMPYQRYVHCRHGKLADAVRLAETAASHGGTVIIERPAK